VSIKDLADLVWFICHWFSMLLCQELIEILSEKKLWFGKWTRTMSHIIKQDL